MKRNSMLTKIIAVLLCALMVAAWLPKTSAAANDFESGMDRIYGTDAANAMPLVIGTNADSGLANAYYAYTPAEDGTLTLTAEDGTTLTVDGVDYTDAVAVTAGKEYIIVATNAAKNHSFTAAFEAAPTGPVYDEKLTVSTSMTLGSIIGSNATVKADAITSGGYTNVYVKVVHYADGEVIETDVRDSLKNSSGEIIYTYSYNVAAKQMNDKLVYTAYAETADGTVVYGPSYEWSIKAGLISQLDSYSPYYNYAGSDAYKNRCNLCVDMLNYGAEAQLALNYDTNNLVNADLPEKYKAYAMSDDDFAGITATNTAGSYASNKLWNYSLSLAETVMINATFVLASKDYTGYEIKVTHGDEVTTYGPDDFVPYGTGYEQIVTVQYDELVAKEMRDTVTFQLFKNGAAVSDVYEASIEGCAKGMLTGNNKNVVIAMMKYSDSAKISLGG